LALLPSNPREFTRFSRFHEREKGGEPYFLKILITQTDQEVPTKSAFGSPYDIHGAAATRNHSAINLCSAGLY